MDSRFQPESRQSDTVPNFSFASQSTDVEQVIACHKCNIVVTGEEYYLANGNPTCAYCLPKVQAEQAAMAPKTRTRAGESSTSMGILGAAMSGVLGAIIYAAIVLVTEFEIGFMAAGLGWLVGYSARRVAGKGSRILQVASVMIVYGSMCLAGLLTAVGFIYWKTGSSMAPAMTSAMQAGPIALLIGLLIASVIYPFASGIMTLLFFGFGMFEAWRQAAARAEEAEDGSGLGAGIVRVKRNS